MLGFSGKAFKRVSPKVDWVAIFFGSLFVIGSFGFVFYSGQKWSKGEPSVTGLEKEENYKVINIFRNEGETNFVKEQNNALMISEKGNLQGDKEIRYFILSDECLKNLWEKRSFPVSLHVNAEGKCEWQKIRVNGH